MKCQEIRDRMPDLAMEATVAMPEIKQHLQSCVECAGKLDALRQTMALLDEWEAPEPSQYFDVRLQARLREEMVKQPAGWLQWIRKPALALSLAVLMGVSITLFRGDGHPRQEAVVTVQPGTAVGDLQALDKNHDLYSDFDMLDDLEVQQNVNANP